MLHRREILFSSIGAGIAALGGVSAAAPASGPIRATLKQDLGAGESVAGRVAVVIDDGGARMVAFGSSGVPGLALNGDTVFEIGSITKVLTALMFVDMAARGEVAPDDPVAKYLPPSMTLQERGRPITLLDLATYTSGLPNMPSNMGPKWWTNPNPFADYTPDKLYEFLSSYAPSYEPGTHYQYANLGFGLLGLALSHRAGKSYEELLVERVCTPLGLNHTRITLSGDMQRHLAQGHDFDLKPAPLWDIPALPGMGAVRSTAKDMTVVLKVCMGIKQTPLNAGFKKLLETRRHTSLAGTDVGLGWFISSDQTDEVAWKSGLTGGFASGIAFSTRRRHGVLVLANGGGGVVGLTMNLFNPDFHPNISDSLMR